jgi:uncharacterized phage protein (TIGR01671 family)
MEEIKFRAWHNKEKKMLIVTRLDFMVNASGSKNEECEGYWGCNNRVNFDISDVTLLQYTGLKDANGKEICEGDQISYQTKHSLRYARVVKKNGMFCCPISRKDESDLYVPLIKFIERHKVEVIGNVYENI